jgi:hypothetical protein
MRQQGVRGGSPDKTNSMPDAERARSVMHSQCATKPQVRLRMMTLVTHCGK